MAKKKTPKPAPTANGAATMPAVLTTSKGVEIRLGDRVTVNGVGTVWTVAGFDEAPMVLLQAGSMRSVVHVNALRLADGNGATAPPAPQPEAQPPAVSAPVRSRPQPLRKSPTPAPADGSGQAPGDELASHNDSNVTLPPRGAVGRPWVQDGGPFSIVRIAKDGKTDYYLMEVVSLNTFELTKLKSRATTRYRVTLPPAGTSDPARPACGCDGFLSHRHCKHIESLEALRAAGKV